MNIFKKFKHLSNLTNNEEILINYIDKYPKEFISLKPKEISAKIHVSVPTIYRLINKLGLSGINDLKVEIRTYLKNRDNIKIENIDYPILPTDTHYDVMLKLKEVYGETINDTLDLADPETLVKVCEQMLKAKNIDIYTSAANVFFAENFKFQMQEINVMVNVPKEDYVQRLSAANSNSSHVAIVISFGGRGHAFKDLVKILKNNNTTIVLITSTEENPLLEYADYKIFMSSSENHYNKISSFSTRMTLLYILDTLYANYFKMDYENNINRKIGTYKKINSNV